MWIQLFTLGSPAFSYFRPVPPDWGLIVALALDVVALACVLYASLWAVHHGSRALRICGLVIFATASFFVLNELEQLAVAEITKQNPQIHLEFLQIVLPLVFALALWRASRLTVRLWQTTLLIFSPLFFILLANTTWLYRAPLLRHAGAGHAAGILPHGRKLKHRVIWIIFDEMDQQLAFGSRPSRIHLPHFDQFSAESLHASKAVPPSFETLYSMPALICGRKITKVKTSPIDLAIQFAGSKQFVSWSAQPTVFSRARDSGMNTGLSGWYHPYCRILGKNLSDCFWIGSGGLGAFLAEDLLREQGMTHKSLYWANWQARSVPFAWFFGAISPQPRELRLNKRRHAAEYQAITENASRMLKNQDIDLLFIHLPAPHPPGMWDEKTHSFTDSIYSTYLDNLELADETLGQFRQLLEHSGDWDRSTVLLSADHPLRSALWKGYKIWDDELERAVNHRTLEYIPFLLKLPGQKTGSTYSRKFNTVISQELVWQILNGTIETPESASAWIDKNAPSS